MKLSILLFLLGFISGALCNESSTCTQGELIECHTFREKTIIETEEDMDGFCRELECLLSFHDNCGSEFSAMSSGAYEHYQKVYGSLCFQEKPLRKKYISNSRCLVTVTDIVSASCKNDEFPLDKEQICRNLPSSLKCANEVVERECGEDARDVFAKIYPGYAYFEC